MSPPPDLSSWHLPTRDPHLAQQVMSDQALSSRMPVLGAGYQDESKASTFGHLPLAHLAFGARPEMTWRSSGRADAHSFDYMLVHSREAKKFDPDGNYVRRWLPVLGRMPAKWIHRCCLMSRGIPF